MTFIANNLRQPLCGWTLDFCVWILFHLFFHYLLHLLCPFLLLSSTSKQQKTQKAAKVSEISDPILLDRYIAIADYNKVKKNECSLMAGQTVEVIDKNQNGEGNSLPEYIIHCISVNYSISQCTIVYYRQWLLSNSVYM